MANNQLIRGAAKVYASQAGGMLSQNAIQQGVTAGLDMVGPIIEASQNKRKAANAAYTQQVNSYMGQLKTPQDFTGFTPEETSTMRGFLMQQRNKYAQAAKMAAKFQDTTDPNYMMYVDQMNAVNNSFTNLAAQLENYKKGKLEYAENQINGKVSSGNIPAVTDENQVIYGFKDEDKDGVNDYNDQDYIRSFYIGEGGNLKFMVNGSEVLYNDVRPVELKDYQLANTILSGNEAVFNSGNKMNTIEQEQYVLKLNQDLANPNALRSLIFDFDDAGLRLEAIANQWQADYEEDGVVDYQYYRELVINQLVKARNDVANEGAREKKRKNNNTDDFSGYTKGKSVPLRQGNGAGDGGKDLPPGDYYIYTHVSKPPRYRLIQLGAGGDGDGDGGSGGDEYTIETMVNHPEYARLYKKYGKTMSNEKLLELINNLK